MLSRLCDPQIHLWCNTCWLYGGQHGSRAFSIRVLADVSTSIGGGSGLEPMTICAARSKHSAVNHSVTPAGYFLQLSSVHWWLGYEVHISFSPNILWEREPLRNNKRIIRQFLFFFCNFSRASSFWKFTHIVLLINIFPRWACSLF